MPIRTALWKVTALPTQLPEAVLPSEKLLEDMIVAQPLLLSDAWMLIGRQERTGQGGIIDLLAIAPDGSLVLIELKRDRTPRDVVAQALDYASWVEALQPEDIAAIYRRFKVGQSLSDDFKARFGQPLDEETLNQSHQIVIVAAQLDDSATRAWAEAVQYGFICGGGGAWYSRTLQVLRPDDRVWVNVPGAGFVGVGRVTGCAVQAADFKVAGPQGESFALDVLVQGDYHREFAGDSERSEWFVPVEWLKTVPLEQAVREIGFFGNQNTVCKPTTPKWRSTVERLKQLFNL